MDPAQLMVALDSTVANIALPSAQHDLGFSSGERQWVITAYSPAFGSPLLLGGQLSDVVGPKRTFMAGLLFRRRGPQSGLSPGPARHSGPEHRAGRGPFR
ncbi:MFS family permease [Arthrobacter silviterrae]|uniref:MFS transporter n=1 Tax=Arthrobacter silviterrae TaxID=2026658 RepID=A0ABX0DCY1_9MICC|nr:MFS transporter [Arthrobacter silviterrae]MDQ0279484.1 MFS family permease [Arthrobacter silviterrae]NGN82037.1 MFS transporter [Arthrobacter silviterrae]